MSPTPRRRSRSLPLAGRVALVAGATRGAGRGIAVALGAAGATVYCSGRSTRARPAASGRPETIDETAELVTAAGGTGIAVRADHTERVDVQALLDRVREAHGGLDVLVNDVWGGDESAGWLWAPLETTDLDAMWALARQALYSHHLTAQLAIPLLRGRRRPLIVEVTDGDTLAYRGAFAYDFLKVAVMRTAFALAQELRAARIAVVAVTPGFLRSEAMLAHFGVTEATWRDAIRQDRHFAASESPRFVGRGIAALAADPDVLAWSGQTLSSWELGRRYRLRDDDGSRPDWLAHWQRFLPRRHPGMAWMRAGAAWEATLRARARAFLRRR